MSIPTIARNAFQHTLAGFSATQDPSKADLFSKAAVETYEAKTWTEWGYQFTQIFEPGVLREVAMLEGLAYESLQSMKHRPSPSLRWLGERADAPADLSFKEKLNVAAALISRAQGPSASARDCVRRPPASPRQSWWSGRHCIGAGNYAAPRRASDGRAVRFAPR
jgi:hypothetical protein